jgi:hypothetical protein
MHSRIHHFGQKAGTITRSAVAATLTPLVLIEEPGRSGFERAPWRPLFIGAV